MTTIKGIQQVEPILEKNKFVNSCMQMNINILPILLLLYICNCKAINDNCKGHVGYFTMGCVSDVVVVKGSTPMSSTISFSKKGHLSSSHFIDISYGCIQDSIINELVYSFTPNVIKEIHSYGKDIIPDLISHIDINESGMVGFVNPYESNLQNVFTGPLGINYAYMIELIMAKDSIMTDSVFANSCCYSCWEESIKPYKIYDQCVIARKDDLNNPPISKITIDDMKTIKNIYRDWWESHKNENIDSLREEWQENGSPLQLSSFIWL